MLKLSIKVFLAASNFNKTTVDFLDNLLCYRTKHLEANNSSKVLITILENRQNSETENCALSGINSIQHNEHSKY